MAVSFERMLRDTEKCWYHAKMLRQNVDHVPSKGVATREKIIEPAVTSVFANVNLPLLTLVILAHIKCKYYFI